MKRLILVWVMILCILSCGVMAADASAESPLIGLWHFETDDDWYTSYVEFTEDGLYVFQMIEDGVVIRNTIDSFADEGGYITLGSRGDCLYALDGDRLMIYYNGREMPPSVYRRETEHPSALMRIERSGDFCYALHDESCAVILRYMGEQNPTANLFIPDQLNGYPVTEIAAGAFSGAKLASVTVPSSVLVREGAFRSAFIDEVNTAESTRTDSRLPSGNTVTAMATPIDPEHLEKVSCRARILGYDEDRNVLTVELIVPEVFAEDEILEIKVGDAIYTGREEITIRTIEWHEDDGYLVINRGAYEHASGSVYLQQDVLGNYMPDHYGHPTYNTLAVIECPVTDTLLFLDYTSEVTGDALKLPRISTAAEFLDYIRSIQNAREIDHEYVIGLDIDNVYVVFDGEGKLATVQRYFVSWQ